MSNDLIPQKSWWSKNWKWLIPVFLLIVVSIGILSSISGENTTDIVQAYSEKTLYENAIAKAKTNQKVLEVLGEIEPIDKLAILEGSAIYSNNKNSIKTSIRIKGSKAKGKLDIDAKKIGSEWIYKSITVRIKNSKVEITVFPTNTEVLNPQNTNDDEPIQNPIEITKDYMSFWTYWGQSVKLSDDLVALDSNSKVLNKGAFLKLLATGKYLPVRLSSQNEFVYRLYNIDKLNNKDISNTIIQMANTEIENSNREGKPFNNFNFTDVNGTIYNSKNTKGKIIVFKFWFIHCQQCVAEIPSLNNLVKQYKNRNDVLFISVALDKNEELKKFLSKKQFNYAIVGNQDEFIKDNLKIEIYPTHMIVNKQGKITKVVNSFPELEIALKKEIEL